MDIYNIESGIWSLGEDGGTARAKHQSLLIDNYVCYCEALIFDRYDLEADSWALSIGPDNNRQSFGLAFVKNNILLVGGLDDLFQSIKKHSLVNLGDIERFQAHEFLVERSSHQSILYEGKLYSFGGEDIFSNILDSLEVLVIDPLSKNTINSPPVVSNIGVIGGGSDLTINFDLLDEEGDFQIELEMEYSLNQGGSFHKALGFSKPLEGFKPGLSQAVVWKTLSDFASDQANVMIRLHAKDGISISTNPAESQLFDVNNENLQFTM